MREEVFGLEDCFKLCPRVMNLYIFAELDGRDSSVELYFVNNWVRELGLRDLIDRVTNASNQNEERFIVIFTWLLNQKLLGSEENYQMEDFRKASVILAQSVDH